MSRPPRAASDDLPPGLLVLHGNRLEWLRDAVVDWIGRHPLAPLETEVFLVQSNGAAEWLKMALARQRGVCAATRVELPARFLWRAYRGLLGAEAVPPQSALDRPALAWRLMRRLPARLSDPVFAPVARFLAGARGADAVERRWQLAQRLADLYDQYQVYRADWLDDWAQGHDRLRADGRPAIDVPADQRWQPALWRDLLAELEPGERAALRPEVHRAFVEHALAGRPPAGELPRRVVLFGASHVPAQTLEALAALGRHAQVILAVPNPCRWHWSDIIEGRELLRGARARHASRGGRPLAELPLEAMHAHAHPLLAAWGRQGRDFMRQLDAFDDADEARRRFAGLPRIDLFDDEPGDTMLAQLQADIRDLVPPGETPRREVPAHDRSIVFHVAHSAQREVEVLHDALLRLLAEAPPDRPLAPRDIVVMVPDIEAFAPAIRAVFGQVPRDDARWIPFEIADLQPRGAHPLVVALEWLLRAPSQRFRASEVRDLLDVPGIAARFGLDEAVLPRLVAWIADAGVRWGLHEAQRASLGLAECGEQNSWAFGLRRMLLGYAVGAGSGAGALPGEDIPGEPWHGIEPHAEIGGLDAACVGGLADLLRVLDAWWSAARVPAAPHAWADRARRLLEDLVSPVDERERLVLAALQQALADWLEHCDRAGFEQPLPLGVVREAWLGGLDEPGAGGGRFLAGGVTFCTLMPLRAVPFEVVALLGMNDGDFPRAGTRNDFDLMALPGRQRPGDRSRRDDDRYLMLEALLSARRVLHVSWTGRSVRDNAEQPPSVLVSQLRDHLRAHWQPAPTASAGHAAGAGEGEGGAAAGDIVQARTTEHPLQPFSRRYFEAGSPLSTWAREWRTAHVAPATEAAPSPAAALPAPDEAAALTLERLADFLRAPVRQFFRVQLGVDLQREESDEADDEPFSLDPLATWQMVAALVREAAAARQAAATAGRAAPALAPGETASLFDPPPPGSAAALDDAIDARLRVLRREGRLPMAAFGEREARRLGDLARPIHQATERVEQAFPVLPERVPVHVSHEGAVLDDWLAGLRTDASGERLVRLDWSASRLLRDKAPPRPRHFLVAWVHALAAAAIDCPVSTVLVGQDATVTLPPPDPAAAREALHALLAAWRAGMDAPLPLEPETAFTWIEKGEDEEPAAATYEGDRRREGAIARDPALARMFPDFDALSSDGRFFELARSLLAPVVAWVSGPGVTIAPHGEDEAAAEVRDGD